MEDGGLQGYTLAVFQRPNGTRIELGLRLTWLYSNSYAILLGPVFKLVNWTDVIPDCHSSKAMGGLSGT